MPFRITLPLVLVAAFAAAGVVGTFALPQLLPAGNVGGNPDVIKVVSSMPRSGSARGQTDTIRNGLLLAFHEVGNKIELTDPATGEKKTYKLAYEDLDDATASAGDWTIEQEIANANYARRDPDVMAYIGTYNSGAAKVSMPITNRANLLMISPANTAESLTKPGTGERHEPECYRPTGKLNYVRVVPTDDLQSLLTVYFIARSPSASPAGLGAKRIYILDDNQLYGKGLADAVEKNCKDPKLGFNIEVLGRTSIDPKAPTYETLMTKIKGQRPDVIYFGGTTQSNAGQLIQDMKNAGLGVPMVGPDGTCENAIIKAAGADTFVEVPFYATFPGLTPDGLIQEGGRGKKYVEGYADLYADWEVRDGVRVKVPKPPSEAYAVYGYEVGVVLLDVFKRAGRKDREAIRQAAFDVEAYHGATGRFRFDPTTGDTTNQFMTVNRVQKTTEIDPETKKEKVVTKFVLAARLELPPELAAKLK
jgi:branched-chain amino acid transport system substrate-binding protein